ncbi:MAG: hypothetical protein EOO90_17145 [Pedobacter sp.]|nr:MAG: hypothetical protein EOO90_17145 [Pedobacter sp.]
MENKEIYEIASNRARILIENSIEEFSELVIQLAMSGEFSDVSDLFKEGEEVIFSVGDFLNSSDIQIQSMIKILNSLRDVQDSLNKNI